MVALARLRDGRRASRSRQATRSRSWPAARSEIRRRPAARRRRAALITGRCRAARRRFRFDTRKTARAQGRGNDAHPGGTGRDRGTRELGHAADDSRPATRLRGGGALGSGTLVPRQRRLSGSRTTPRSASWVRRPVGQRRHEHEHERIAPARLRARGRRGASDSIERARSSHQGGERSGCEGQRRAGPRSWAPGRRAIVGGTVAVAANRVCVIRLDGAGGRQRRRRRTAARPVEVRHGANARRPRNAARDDAGPRGDRAAAGRGALAITLSFDDDRVPAAIVDARSRASRARAGPGCRTPRSPWPTGRVDPEHRPAGQP
jgi:hypothetical protein